MAGRLEGKVALVTGGASGIGAETSRVYAREGAKVAITDVNDDGGHAVAQEIGDAAFYAHLDTRFEGEWQAVIKQTVDSYGRLDILVNAAGVPGRRPGGAGATLPRLPRHARHDANLADNLGQPKIAHLGGAPPVGAGCREQHVHRLEVAVHDRVRQLHVQLVHPGRHVDEPPDAVGDWRRRGRSKRIVERAAGDELEHHRVAAELCWVGGDHAEHPDEVGVPAAAGGESASRGGVSLPAGGGSGLEWKRFVKLASARLASTSTLRSFCSESGTVWPAAEMDPCIRPVSRLEDAGSEPRVAEPRVARVEVTPAAAGRV